MTTTQCRICLGEFVDWKVNSFFCCSLKYCKECYDRVKKTGKCAQCKFNLNSPKRSIRSTDMYQVTVKMSSPNSNRLISIESKLFRNNWNFQLDCQDGRVNMIEFTCTDLARPRIVHKITVTAQQLLEQLSRSRLGMLDGYLDTDDDDISILGDAMNEFLGRITGTSDNVLHIPQCEQDLCVEYLLNKLNYMEYYDELLTSRLSSLGHRRV